jgi:Holliday junction DNA helicase RuvA
MIALVRGEVLLRRTDYVVVDCGGVGYRLALSAQSLRQVPAVGKQVVLYAHLIMRDDAVNLYGFASEDERDLFLALLSVKSIGPKVALSILSGGTPSDLRRALAASDVARFQAVPGIGKRTAERIIVELREQAAKEQGARSESNPDDVHTTAREGLMALGFSLVEAEKLLGDVAESEPQTMIAQALKRARQPTAAS